jgi:hypothetical protein
MARHRPRAPKVVVSHGKDCEGLRFLRKKRRKSLVEWGKWLNVIPGFYTKTMYSSYA